MRHSARLGSVNQQKFAAPMCRTLARLDSRLSRCWSVAVMFGAAAAILPSTLPKNAVSSRPPGPAGMIPLW